MKRTVILSNAEIEAVAEYMESDKYCFKKENNTVGVKTTWAMFKNKKEIMNLKQLVDAAREEINAGYLGDDKSEVVTDENGQEVRRVRQDFLEPYTAEVIELNRQKNEVVINTISIEDLTDCSIDDNDFGYISFMLEENDDVVTADSMDAEPEVVSGDVE